MFIENAPTDDKPHTRCEFRASLCFAAATGRTIVSILTVSLPFEETDTCTLEVPIFDKVARI